MYSDYSDIYELALWSPDDSTAVTDESDPNAKLTDQERLLIHIKQQQDNMQSDLTDIEAKITGRTQALAMWDEYVDLVNYHQHRVVSLY